MNNPHQGARLTVHSRELIVARHAGGRPARRIADDFGVSVRTVHKWLRRYRDGGKDALANGASAPAVGDLAQACGVSQSTMSQQLRKLKEARLVTGRREGQTVYYSVTGQEALAVLETLHGLYCARP